MSQIKRRVQKIEEKMKIASKGETLEEQFRNFKEGNYGTSTLMTIVVAYLEKGDKGLEGLPKLLKNWFRETIEKAKHDRNYHLDDAR